MSHTNTTTNYGLPQFLSSDKPAWMADINVAFADIDAQMKTNADAASAAQTTADDAVLNGAPGYSNLSTYAVGDVVNYLGRVYKCDIAVTTPEAFDSAKWSYYRLSDASAQLDVIDGEIGSTDISGIGDGSITGAISTVNSNLTNLFEYRGAVPSGELQTETLSSGSNYIYALTGSDALCGLVVIRTTNGGTVNHSDVPSAVSVTLGTNYIKFHNNSTGNTMQIFRLTLHI